MTLTTIPPPTKGTTVSDACQINDFDHTLERLRGCVLVSDACQINDFDHKLTPLNLACWVSDACQINDFDQVMRNSVRGTSVAVFWIASGVCF